MARHEKPSTHEEAGEGEGRREGRAESSREDGQGLQADAHPGVRVGSVPVPPLVAVVLLLTALPAGPAAGGEPASPLPAAPFTLLTAGPPSACPADGEHP